MDDHDGRHTQGGTTGLPKLIPRTHDDYVYNVRASAKVCNLSAEDTYLAALPVGHNFAFGCPGILGTLMVGGRVIMAGSGNPDEVFSLVEYERATFTALVPPLAMLWLDAAANTKSDLSSLRLLQVGGAKIWQSARRARQGGARVHAPASLRHGGRLAKLHATRRR